MSGPPPTSTWGITRPRVLTANRRSVTVTQPRLMLRRSIGVVLGMLSLYCATSSIASTPESAYVYVGRGSLGKVSRWEAWLEGDSGRRSGPLDACLSVDAVGPPVGGLVTEGELRECGRVTRRSPLVQIVTAKGDNRNPNTVVAIAAAAGMNEVSFDVGTRGKRAFRLRQMSAEEAERLGTRPMSYGARAFPGRLCIENMQLHGGGRTYPLGGKARPCR